MAEVKVERPLGIAILAVLDIIGGFLALFGGMTLAALSGMMAEMIGELPGFGAISGVAIEAIFMALGITAIILGIIGIAVGWGFWKGSGWAWTLGVILYIIGIILGLVSLIGGNITSIISIIIGALLVYYLFSPNVKAWFGKA